MLRDQLYLVAVFLYVADYRLAVVLWDVLGLVLDLLALERLDGRGVEGW